LGADLIAGSRAAPRPPSSEKGHSLLELLRRHRARGEKVIVFTAFRDTLEFLAALMSADGLPAALYHGSLSRRQKDASIRAFQAELPVLLSSEAGGEGRNLQFCHVMINFDLPWNPMRIEQRLGRKARLDLLPMQPGDVPSTMADVSALEKAVGFRPRTSIDDGISAFVNWYLEFYAVDREANAWK